MCKKLMFLLSCVLFLCATTHVAKADIIAYWPFDEGSGDVAADVVGGFDAQLTNVDWVAGQFGGFALESDRSGDEILAGEGPTPTTQDLSLAWWMVDNYDSYQTIMNKYETDSTAGNGILLRPVGEDRPLRWRLGGWQAYGGWGAECGVPQGAYSDGEWTHVVCTYDSASDTATIYINGVVPVNTDNPEWNPKTGIAGPAGYCEGVNDPTQPLYIVGQRELFGGIIDEVAIWDSALTPDEVVSVYELGPLALDPTKASHPNPSDEAVDVPRDMPLDWTPGIYAQKHNVYLGTSLEDVNSADTTHAQNVQASLGQTEGSYEPGPLAFDQTYYWRVDEVNAAPDNTVNRGPIWSFTVEPFSIMIPVDVSKATASSSTDANPPSMIVNGSGLEGNTHSEDTDTMWLSAQGDMDPWLMVEFDQPQKLDKMLVWNSNSKSETFIGWGIKDVNIETSMDGVDWTALGDTSQISRAPGKSNYNEPQAVDLGLALAKYVRLNILSNWGGVLPQYGVSEVQFYGLPVYARTPDPASGAADVLPDSVVTWRAGREASQHTVYVDTDQNAVTDGSASSVSSSTDSVDLRTFDLQLDTTYYWKVDEVNDAVSPSVWPGPVWNLSTTPFLVVDDFESYGNLSPNRPFQTWLDGFGYSADEFFPVAYAGNGTGSGIGHDIWSPGSPYFDGSIMETGSTIAGSRQSMPFYFDNSDGGASQTERTFAVPQDWTVGGAKTLSIMFNGQGGNTGTLFVMINNAKVTYQRDNGNISRGAWQAWNIDLATVNTTLSNITKLTLGVEGAGATGMILFDDIRLYPKAGDVITPTDPGSENLAAAWSFDEGSGTVAGDSSGHGRNGTIIDATWADGIQGKALNFNGSTAYVNIDGFKGINAVDGVQQPFTIANWIKTVSDGEMVTWGIQAAATRLSWRVEGGVLRTEHAAGNLRSNTPVNDDEWHHVALVVTEGANLRVPATQFYLDGMPDTTNSGSDTPYNLSPDSDVRIGMSGPLEDRFFTGLIDEVKLYDRALSGAELMWLSGKTLPIDKPF